MWKRLSVVLAAVALVPAAATAAPFNVYVGSENPGAPYVRITAPDTLANGVTVMVGSVQFSGDLGTFEAYCVDINHYITPNRWYQVSNPVSSMSAWGEGVSGPSSPDGAGSRAAYLYNTFAGTGSLAGYSEADRRWGLQVAIWNSLYDSDFDVLGGTGFRISNPGTAGVAAANAMLASLSGYAGPAMDAAWLRLVDGPGNGTQDFIGRVPEPGSLLLLAVGLFGIAWVARRRTRQA